MNDGRVDLLGHLVDGLQGQLGAGSVEVEAPVLDKSIVSLHFMRSGTCTIKLYGFHFYGKWEF